MQTPWAKAASMRQVLAKISQEPEEEPRDITPCELVLDLPAPPSVNRTMGSRLGSRHWLVKDWRRAANAHLLATRQSKHLRLITGTVSIKILWETQNLADIDNRIKHLFDYLEFLNVLDNDNRIRDLHVSYGLAPAGCRVSIRRADW